MQKVRMTARALLYTDIHETEFSPVVVQHPFTNSGVVLLRNYGNGECVNILEDQTAQEEWRNQIRGLIDKADDVFSIFALVNKPYKMTFIKYCLPYLSRTEYTSIFAEAWVRSENPNSDPNFTPEELFYMKGLSEAKMVCTLDGGIAFVNALDERWRSYFDKSLTPYVAPRAHEYDADACLFYNASTGEYNKPPTEAGRYDIILLCFSRVENTLYILEYTLTV